MKYAGAIYLIALIGCLLWFYGTTRGRRVRIRDGYPGKVTGFVTGYRVVQQAWRNN